MSRRRVRYHVYYGSATSRQNCYTLADGFSFVAYCLREGVLITHIAPAAGAD